MTRSSHASKPALRVHEATKSWGDTLALDTVSFSVDGGIFGLLGGNGAGKSTLLRAIVHLTALDRGTIEIRGFDSVRDTLDARHQVGYLPEEPVYYERLTGWEYLQLIAGLKKLDNADERAELLSHLGLSPEVARTERIGNYSLGMRKKIGLTAALMGSPPLILLDEPLNGLDTDAMRRLRLRLETLASSGSTIVLSSHVMSFVERVCERMVILKAGRVAALGSPADIRQQSSCSDSPFEDVFLDLAAAD
ncbi:MAG: ABC transporter ATP-binding protein [Acidobacteriota bacterium]